MGIPQGETDKMLCRWKHWTRSRDLLISVIYRESSTPLRWWFSGSYLDDKTLRSVVVNNYDVGLNSGDGHASLPVPDSLFKSSCQQPSFCARVRGYMLDPIARIWPGFHCQAGKSYEIYTLAGVLVPWMPPVVCRSNLVDMYLPLWFDGYALRTHFVPPPPPPPPKWLERFGRDAILAREASRALRREIWFTSFLRNLLAPELIHVDYIRLYKYVNNHTPDYRGMPFMIVRPKMPPLSNFNKKVERYLRCIPFAFEPYVPTEHYTGRAYFEYDGATIGIILSGVYETSPDGCLLALNESTETDWDSMDVLEFEDYDAE